MPLVSVRYPIFPILIHLVLTAGLFKIHNWLLPTKKQNVMSHSTADTNTAHQAEQ